MYGTDLPLICSIPLQFVLYLKVVFLSHLTDEKKEKNKENLPASLSMCEQVEAKALYLLSFLHFTMAG